jgi:ubiquinone/menaquinone biosynthesis C-methylase UbiE
MNRKDITSANREAWEEAAPLHRAQNMAQQLAEFREPGYSCLDEIETARLMALGVAGKDVAQLCCNNGRELLSVKNLGAGNCVGFDGAEGFVEQARELAAAGDLACEFVCSDVYEIPADFDSSFDLVTITIGVLSWMPDLPGFLAVAARLLRPGGAVFIYEQHPILDMIEPAKADEPVAWDYSYFRREPFVELDGLDYYGGGTYESKPLTSFHYTLSDVIMAGLACGLFVEHIEELPGHISNAWYNVEHQGPALPMSYTLVLRNVD